MHKEQSSHLYFSSQISCPERDMTLTHEMTLFFPHLKQQIDQTAILLSKCFKQPRVPAITGHIQTDYSDEFELFKVNTCLLKLRWFYIFNNDWVPVITDGQQRQCLQWSDKIHSLSRGVLFWLSIFFHMIMNLPLLQQCFHMIMNFTLLRLWLIL